MPSRIVTTLLLALALTGGGWSCDSERFQRLCGLYERGSSWADKVLPVLDVAASLTAPDWAKRYFAAKQLYKDADARVDLACAAEKPPDKEPAETAAGAIRSLIALHNEIAGEAPGEGPVMSAKRPPLISLEYAPPPGLDADMAELEREASQ